MNPLAVALRRNRALFGAVVILVVFMLAHQFVFLPAAQRYERAVRQGAELGLSLDASPSSVLLPPRVFARVADNALTEQQALEDGNSGVLTAKLLEEATRIVSQNGMEVVMTEPGPVTQQSRNVQVRAHLRVRGRYAQIVGLFDALARHRMLLAVDRFNATAGSGRLELDLWMSRYVLKREPAGR